MDNTQARWFEQIRYLTADVSLGELAMIVAGIIGTIIGVFLLAVG